MEFFELPLNPFPESFSVTIANVEYNGTTRWSVPLSCWVLSLLDSQNSPLLLNIPLVPGVDLLGQFEYLGIAVDLRAVVDHDATAAPGYAQLGATGHVYVGV